MNELKILRELGFSLNEAKCYIALHKSSPMTGYEVAKKAKITRT
ncbi:MAG: TrmB family transcriptional regulator, partial [Thermotogaceae bacterium]|nr:TrmB family transcriptional regulator [Thermotogaceae bacterium]